MTETEKKRSALIIYLSLHGTTRKAAEALCASLMENGVPTDVYNLSEFKDKGDMEKLNTMIPSYPLIIFCSPTYFHHAPPLFTDFVKNIPDATCDQAAAILSTFGGVYSGVIQFDLAKILYEKKYSLIGGIKVLTVHCLTFQEKKPFYEGHPDETDLTAIREFGKQISIRVMNKNRQRYSPIAFKDKPFLLNFIDDHIHKMKNLTWAMPGIKVKREKCTGCGLCVKNCPANNITLEQTAVHGKDCTFCYSCVKICPSGATKSFLKPAAPAVKWLAKIFARYEEQTTQQVV